ncbi:MAG: small multi-drug export protein [Lachnospiraceae bacterium]|nr:small multi-drug export protein [Lachnospiraceae bacterium]
MLKQYLITFFISMVPLIELRGAIPYSQVVGLPLLPSYIVCIIGNMLPVPIIFFFARKVLEWGCDKPVIGKFFTFCLEKGHKGGEKLKEKAGKGLFWALILFVGIPLPGTGAWTGTLAASILDMDFKSSVLACIGGVLLAGIIMGVASTGVLGALSAIF